MNVQEIAYKRLIKLSEELKKLPNVLALKLSGSVADNSFFFLQFDEEVFVASDYDVVLLVEDYPEKDLLSEIEEKLKRRVLNTDLEDLLIKLLDIKVFTVKFPYEGEGVKVPSVHSGLLSVKRHLCGGEPVFGEKFLEKFKVEDAKTLKQLAFRILYRKRIFDCFTELGALIRISKLLKWKDLEKRIIELVKKYRNYHVLTDSEISAFKKEVDEVTGEVRRRLKEF